MGFTDLLADLYSSFTFTEVQAEAQAHKAADVDHVVQGKPDHPDYQADGSKERNEDGKEAEGDNDEGSKGEEAGEDDAGSDDSGDTSDSGDGQDEAEAEPEQEEAAEEEQEEPEDPKPKLEEECARSTQCTPYKHHYEECVERVTEQESRGAAHKGPKEDCVEEFFHLTHCATQCAAPKLFAQLK